MKCGWASDEKNKGISDFILKDPFPGCANHLLLRQSGVNVPVHHPVDQFYDIQYLDC